MKDDIRPGARVRVEILRNSPCPLHCLDSVPVLEAVGTSRGPSSLRPWMRSLAMPLVLVVDDAPQIRRLVRVVLEACGHRVIDAEDGIIGMRLMRAQRPDAVIMDVGMPGPSGLDVLRAMRADPELAAMPVVILTADGLAETEASALADGASGYMGKPFSPLALLALLASLLGT